MENNNSSNRLSSKKKCAVEWKRNRDYSCSEEKAVDKNATDNSPTSRQTEKRTLNHTVHVSSSDRMRRGTSSPVKHVQNATSLKSKESERSHFDGESKPATSANTRQLHKVVKIKYKDGTVALKSVSTYASTYEICSIRMYSTCRYMYTVIIHSIGVYGT